MDTDRLYLPRPRSLFRSGLENIGFATLIWLFWVLDTTATIESRLVAGAVMLMFLFDGAYSIVNRKRGYPRLVANRTGVQVRNLLSTRGAEWRALSDFKVQSGWMLVLWGKSISARMLDTNGKPRRFKRFVTVQDDFQVAPETLAAELNALRGAAIHDQTIDLPNPTPSPAAG